MVAVPIDPAPVLQLPWECLSCYATNPADETHCVLCGTLRGNENPPEDEGPAPDPPPGMGGLPPGGLPEGGVILP